MTSIEPNWFGVEEDGEKSDEISESDTEDI